MDSGLATVVAASIAGFASIVGILLKFRKENREDHGSVMGFLEMPCQVPSSRRIEQAF